MTDRTSSRTTPDQVVSVSAVNDPSTNSDDSRWKYGLFALALGLSALLVALLIILCWKPENATTLLGLVSSPIAAIVGAYFGIQVTASTAKDAQDQANTARAQAKDAQDAKDKALADRATVLGALPPDVAATIAPQLSFNP
jgi:hypothetical protein